MLGKLLKHDFKWINKIMYIYFIVLFIITIPLKIVESIKQDLLLVIIDKILSIMFIVCIVSIIITCIMRIWSRFIKNVYKDESYLTHTLPITKNQIFNSKIIAAILSLLLSIIVIVICFSIVYFNNLTIENLKAMYQSLVDTYNSGFAIAFIIGLILIVLLEIFYFMMTGIFAIVLGYRSNNNKTIKSIIIGIISYGILSIISLIILGIMSRFADFKIVSEGFPSLNTVRIMGLTGIIVYLAYNLMYYFLAKHLLNKGVNVD